ncbi:unnamed protein product [Adineta steineri]|uniref:Cystathionine gamma-synthase n=1 Tax=Adineta steineri TaxID=433720 RepID=A0A814MT55_9BILA|nr:unnamed protein product [Adineta steineri]CAF1082512.1 unnamed protein product [Adineta steineri]
MTRRRVEAVIGAIEGGHAVTYSSGQSAAMALIHCIKPRRIYLNAGYQGVQFAFKLYTERQNIEDEKVQLLTLEQCKEIYDSEKKELRIDTAQTGACLAIDSTLSSPLGLRPLEHGAHVVMHSSTKYLAGHSDVLGGVLIVHSSLSDMLPCTLLQERTTDGAVMGNFETWLLQRSMRTFSLRVRRQCQTALIIVQWLEKQRAAGYKVMKIHHPSLESHSSYSLAVRYLRLLPATFSFELQSESQAKSFARSLLLCAHATSLGGVETLVDWIYSYNTSISPTLLRVSIGVEEPEDIIQDFEQALKQAE